MSSIIDRFRARVKEFPDAPAAEDRNVSLTYAELDDLTDRFAADLMAGGLGKGAFAAVYVTRTVNILTGTLCVLKSGGAFVPVDAEYPQERIGYMVKNAACSVILTEKALWEKKPLPGYDGKLVFLDDGPVSSKAPEFFPDLTEEDDAFLLYTSGTTGTPKGVLHTHGSLIAAVGTLLAVDSSVGHGSRVAVFAGFTFIAAVLFLFAPLLSGGCAYILSEELKQNMDALQRCFRKNRITHSFLPPSLGTVMAEQYDLRGIKLFFAGEKLRPFRPLYPVDAVNMYGSTEGVIVASHTVRGDEKDIPLGRPSEGISIRVIDENGNDAGENETGELIYSGAVMAKGYHLLPEMTAEKWIITGGHRYFRTGDRVRPGADGLLYYVGRADDMVKLHGYRVELGEVEDRITACGCSPCACAVRKIRGSDKLCCFYEQGAPFAREDMEEKLRKVLPSYMIPDLWAELPELPRNANGKIVRRLLLAPEPERRAYTAPDNDVDAMIVKHMEELLDVRQIGMDDCFVDMGGDSVRAMTLSARLKQRGIILASDRILQAENVRQMCADARVRYEEIWTEEEWTALQQEYAAAGMHIQKVLPLSSGQEVMLMDHLLWPDDPGQIRFYSFVIDCCPEEDMIRKALDSISERFERLRTSVVYQDISAIQQVITDRGIPLKMYDAADRTEAEEITRIFREENGPFTFDLQMTSNIRFACIRIGGEDCLILAAVQRLLLDDEVLRGYFAAFFRELETVYPASREIPEWESLLSMGAGDGDAVASRETADGSYFTKMLSRSVNGADAGKTDPKEQIFTYSKPENAKRYIFVHTANTGSEAYYNLAKRISDRYAFAAMEQYNIYHPDTAVYGIKNIAKKYLEFVKAYQPEGPYRLGGWCYGGMIAYEMACLLEQAGEKVEILIMLDSQAAVTEEMKKLARANHRSVDRSYFETCPLFADMRTRGMLETLIRNYRHVAEDVVDYVPSRYHGKVLYFKPAVIPEGSSGASLLYQEAMAAQRAGGYENFIDPGNLTVIQTPHEHDLMMDDVSLDVIVPVLTGMDERGSAAQVRHFHREWTVPAETAEWEQIRSFLMGLTDVGKKERLELCLTAEEIMANIIFHAYPAGTPGSERTIRVTAELNGGVFRMTFADKGIPFDQRADGEALRDFDPLKQIGGAGRMLTAKMADSTDYRYTDGENVFSFEKKLNREERKE